MYAVTRQRRARYVLSRHDTRRGRRWRERALVTSRVPAGNEPGEAPTLPTEDETALDQSSRRKSLRTIAPGTVGARVVTRECGNVSPRGRTGPIR